MRLRGQTGFPKELWKVARKFAGEDKVLIQFLQENMKPNVAPWQEQRAARNRVQDEQRLKRWGSDQLRFNENIAALKAGELWLTLEPARVYLGSYSEFDNDSPPVDRLVLWLGQSITNAALEGFEATLGQEGLPSAVEIAEGYAKGSRWNVAFPIICALVQRTLNGKGFSDLPTELLLLASIILMQDGHLLHDISSQATTVEVFDTLLAKGYDKKSFYRTLIEPQFLAKKDHVFGLYELTRDEKHPVIAAELCAEWLARFPDCSDSDEFELIDCVCKCLGPSVLDGVYLERSRSGFRNDGQRLRWSGVLFLSAETTNQLESLTVADSPGFLWTLRHLFREDLKLQVRRIRQDKLAWIVEKFRAVWPYVERPLGVTSGDMTAWDATEVLIDVIGVLAANFGEEPAPYLCKLSTSNDDYSKHVLHAIAQQQRLIREKNFHGVTFAQLKAVTEQSSPGSIGDLQAYVLEALDDIQDQLRGSDTDPANKYYDQDDLPLDEPTCSQRLIEDLRAIGGSEGIQFLPEPLMPRRKNADIGCSLASMRLPIEVKGQWNKDLWTGAIGQLDRLYTIDSQAKGRGIYLAMWFGKLELRGKKLKSRPKALGRSPKTAAELEQMLTETIPYARRGEIVVKVLDFTR